jgi:hypothetical protein
VRLIPVHRSINEAVLNLPHVVIGDGIRHHHGNVVGFIFIGSCERHNASVMRRCLGNQLQYARRDRLCRLHQSIPACGRPPAPATRRRTCLAVSRLAVLSTAVSLRAR